MIRKSKGAGWLLVMGLFTVAGAFWVRGLREYAESVRGETQSAGAFQASGPNRPNGFDVSNSVIPREEIRAGGPPRDGIPAIDNPKFVTAGKASFLKDDDIVISITHGPETRAYPLRVLAWHEIVNDQIGDRAFAVTYCPLCGTGMVFNRLVDGQKLSFGVSGLLYNGDVLMYDRQTESLWSQLAMKCVVGKQVNASLEWIPSQYLTWRAWNLENPHGRVLSTDTGFMRDYSVSPYDEYAKSPNPPLNIRATKRDLPDKAWVIGLIVNGEAKAYPLEQIPSDKPTTDKVGGVRVEVRYDSGSRSPTVTDMNDRQPLPFVVVYWFAWQAFYPNTGLWRP